MLHLLQFFLPWTSINVRHPDTALFAKGGGRKQFWLVMEDAKSGSEATFWAYGWPLTKWASFKYLSPPPHSHVLRMAVSCGQPMEGVEEVGMDSAYIGVLGGRRTDVPIFFKAVVRAILPFGS